MAFLLRRFLVIDAVVASVVENDAILENLADSGTLVTVGSLEDVDGLLRIGGNTAGEELAACAEAELCWAEWVLNTTEWC